MARRKRRNMPLEVARLGQALGEKLVIEAAEAVAADDYSDFHDVGAAVGTAVVAALLGAHHQINELARDGGGAASSWICATLGLLDEMMSERKIPVRIRIESTDQ